MLEGNSPRGRHSSTSSDHSIDPNDKYSVFRAVDQPEENSITNSPSVDSKDRFGAFQSGDQLVMKALSQPSQVPLFQGGVSQPSSGWNRTEAGSIPVGGSNPPNQQQNFGHFQSLQSVAAHGTNEVWNKLSGCKSLEHEASLRNRAEGLSLSVTNPNETIHWLGTEINWLFLAWRDPNLLSV